jgi:RND family efflux transporter MFP subunit
MNRFVIVLAVALLLPSAAFAEDEPEGAVQGSVLVATTMPVQGTLAQAVTAYGLAQAAPGGSMAVASLHAAQVLRLRVVAGQTVAAGAPLLDLGADPSASLAYAQAVSDVKLAQGELRRAHQMLAERLATNSQVAQAEKAVSDAEATLEARRREGGVKPVETLTAPLAGIVTAVTVSNGDHVQPGVTLLDLAAAGSATGILGIAPADRNRVRPGQLVQLVDLDAPGKPIGGTVGMIGGMADPKTGLFTAVVTPSAADSPALPPGAHLRGTIAVDGSAGWIVPRDAVLSDANGPYLFQVDADKARRIAVSIVAAAGDTLAVTGPLDPARKLVISGNYQLADGNAIREQAEGAGSNEKPGQTN